MIVPPGQCFLLFLSNKQILQFAFFNVTNILVFYSVESVYKGHFRLK